MKKFLIALAFCLFPTVVFAQCNGSFPSNTICGNIAGTPKQPGQIPLSSITSQPISQITRAQIPANVINTTNIVLSGYRTNGDLGMGCTYTTSGATVSGLEAIKDASGHVLNLIFPDHKVSVGCFGAYGDDGFTNITSTDITNNPQWRGTSYVSGTTWDTVAVQESKYAAYATASTSAAIVWNGDTSVLNLEWYLPPGYYGINKQILSVQSGFRDRGAGKNLSVLDWLGPSNQIMWLCDSCSYGQIVDLGISGNTILPSYPNLAPLVSLDHTGNIPGLATQQLTIYDLFCRVSVNGECIEISRNTGIQGDTIAFINPVFLGFMSDYALLANGANALAITVLNGDCQGFYHDCFQANAGNIYTYGSHFENQYQAGDNNTPIFNQFSTHGADFHATAGTGNSNNSMKDVRSESSILTAGFAGVIDINEGSVLGTELTLYPFNSNAGAAILPGIVNVPASSNTKNRAFMVVDDGGNGTWTAITSISGLVLEDTSASYTVNQWATNYHLFIRTSDTATQHCPIVSNTAITVTVSAAISCSGGSLPALKTGMLYHIGGTISTNPNWDTAATGFMTNNENHGAGFYTTATSAVVYTNDSTTDSQIHVNDYLVIPYADQIAPAGGPNVPMPLYGKVLSKATSGCPNGFGFCYTLNHNAAFTVGDHVNQVGAFGYYGTPITDGTESLIDLEFDVVQSAYIIDNLFTTGGKIGASNGKYGNIRGFIFGRQDWLDTTYNASGMAGNVPPGGVFGNMTQGSIMNRLCQTLSTGGSVDLTSVLNNCGEIPYTPTQNATLNAPAPLTVGAQHFDLLITTSGVVSYTITFGTNFSSNGTLATGTVNGAVYTVHFVSDGTTWREAWRSPTSASGSNVTLTANSTVTTSVSAGQFLYTDGTKLQSTTLTYGTDGNGEKINGNAGGGNITLYNNNNPALFVSVARTSAGNGLGIGPNVTPASPDVFLTRAGAADLQFGAADAASPVAQKLQMQSVVAGTTDTAAPNTTIQGALSTGLGGNGDIIITTTSSQSTGTSQNTAAEALRFTGVRHNPKFRTSSTGAGTQTFTNSPCSGLNTEQWVTIEITGQSGTWFVPACQ